MQQFVGLLAAGGDPDGLRAVTASTTPASRTSSTMARRMSLPRRVPAAAVAAAGSAAAVLVSCLMVTIVSFLSGPGPISALAAQLGRSSLASPSRYMLRPE